MIEGLKHTYGLRHAILCFTVGRVIVVLAMEEPKFRQISLSSNMPAVCIQEKCLCSKDCQVVGCMLVNPLFSEDVCTIFEILQIMREKDRMKFLIELLQERRRPKVNRAQLDNYYQLLRKGVDIDVQKISLKKRVEHQNLKNNPSGKRYKILVSPPDKFRVMSFPQVKSLYSKIHCAIQQMDSPAERKQMLEDILLSYSQTDEQILERNTGFLESIEKDCVVDKLLSDTEPDFHEPE